MTQKEIEDQIVELKKQLNDLQTVVARTVRHNIFNYCFLLTMYKGIGFSLEDLPNVEKKCEQVSCALEGAFFRIGTGKEYASLFDIN